MSIRIDLDSLLQVAQELAYDSPGTLIPLLHTNRQIYDLASHLLLLRPDGSYVRVLLPADGDSGGQRRVEGFRDFVLGLKSRHSRRFYLRKLHLEPPWVDSYLSRDSMKMLAEVFDPCFRHPSQDTSPLESTVQLETLRLWMDGLDEMVPLASHLLRLEVETLRTFVCETPWSLPLARLFKEVRAPLRILDLNGKPGLYPLHNLAPLRDTLQELRISLPNAGIFDLTATEGGDIPVFPNVSTLKILGWVIIVNTKTLIETFPSLRHLDIRADVTLRRGYRWSFRPPQRDENIKAMAGCGGNLWSELHSVAGSVQMLYDLALTCKVYLLYLYNADHELDNAGKARDVCADVRPEILHYCCPLSGAFPTCASALEGCASSVKEFSMEVLLGGLSGDGYGDGLNHEGKQREIVSVSFYCGVAVELNRLRHRQTFSRESWPLSRLLG